MRAYILFLVLGTLLFARLEAQSYHYFVEDMGVLPGEESSVARGINDPGDVVGWSGARPFLYTDANGIISLGAFGGAQATWAVDLNNSGVIIGGARSGATEFGIRHAGGLWQNLNLGFSYAYGINQAGQVVGVYGASVFTQQAFMIDPQNGLTTLGLGVARAINDDGWTVGYTNSYEAFLWKPGQGIQTLGTLQGFPRAFAATINSNGDIAGYLHNGLSGTSARSKIFFYRLGSGMTDLGGPGSLNEVWEMNSDGKMVGRYFPSASNTGLYRAFDYVPGHGFRDLNTLINPAGGWVLLWATGINERGQITCDAFNNLIPGSRGVRLTPIPRGDRDMNGCVEDADLLGVLFAFGASGGPEDLNNDGIVNDGDLLIVLLNFGAGC
ncbi:MAG: hypothetical protein KIT45_12620 [Fimbriimonadia bacterium]|nr:hypothetical protein [Fimbriimonadia bacterium]